jgi:hypothetical protein
VSQIVTIFLKNVTFRHWQRAAFNVSDLNPSVLQSMDCDDSSEELNDPLDDEIAIVTHVCDGVFVSGDTWTEQDLDTKCIDAVLTVAKDTFVETFGRTQREEKRILPLL